MRQRGLIARRSVAELTVLTSAGVTVLVTTSLLTALVAYSGAVTDAGVAAVVEAAPARQVSVEVSAPPADDEAADTFDAQVQAVADDAFTGLDPTVHRSRVSASFALPPDLANLPATDGRPPLTVLVAYDDLAAHASLVTGEWATDPAPGGPLPVTVHAEAATALDLRPGDALTVTTRADDEPLDLLVTGTHRPAGAGDPAFFDDVLETTGRNDGSFLALGPFAATTAGYAELVPGRTVVRWRIAPDPALLDVGGIARAVEGADRVEAAVEDDTVSISGQSARILVDTDLQDLDDSVAGPVQVARSTVSVPVLLLALLGAIALVLTVLLLAERRRSETATMRARGANRAQVGRWAAVEALALVLPAAVAAPLLAALVLGLLGTAGPLAGTQLVLSPAPEPSWWLTSALVALVCGAVLVALAVGTADASWRSVHRSRASRGTLLSRAGVDLAMLGLAVLAVQQLRQYGIAGTAGVDGTETDPLVVAAPAVVVLAVAVVALRAMPPVTALMQRGLRRRGSVGAALALWHVGRRPARYAGPALLLVMAIAVGTLSLAYTATWTAAQRDLGTQLAGADVRVSATAPSLRALPASERKELYRDVPGVQAVMAATSSGPGGDGSSEVLAVEADQASAVVLVRDDLVDGATVADLVEPLVAARPALPTVPLPGDATAVQLTVTLRQLGDIPPSLPPVLSALLVDGAGSLRRVPIGELAVDGRPRAVSADLAGARERASGGLALVALDLQVSSFVSEAVALELTVDGLAAGGPSGPSPLVQEEGWAAAATTGGTGVTNPARANLADSGASGFRAGLTTASAARVAGTSAAYRFVAEGTPVPRTSLQQVSGFAPPAVVTRALAERDAVGVGDPVVVDAPGGQLVVEIVATVERLPTLAAGAAALVDLPTLATVQLLRGDTPVQADQWWLATGADASAGVAEAVAAVSGLPDSVLATEGISRARLTAPLGVGLAGALGVGAVAALAVTAIGFAVHGAASARERLTEFAFLRAMGFSRRQLLGVLATEQAVLAVVGVGLGLAAGAVSSALLVPELVAPSLGTGAPPLRLVVDVAWVAGLAAAVLLLLAGVAAAVTRSLRGSGLGAALRLGEDR